MPSEPLQIVPIQQQVKATGPALKTAGALVLRSWRPLLILLIIQSSLQTAIIYAQMLGVFTFPDIPILSPRLLIAALFSAAAIHLLLWRSTPDIEEAVSVSVRAWPHLIAVVLLTHAAIQLGFMFLLLPGIAAYILLKLAPVFVLAERPGVIPALTRSARAVLPMPATLAGLIIGAAVLGLFGYMFTLLPAMIMTAILEGLFGMPEGVDLAQAMAVGFAAGWVTLIDAAVSVAFYLHVRTGGERLDG